MDAEENQKQVSLRAHSPWKSHTARFPHSHRRGEAMEKWKTKSRFSTFPLPCDSLFRPNSERRPGGGASLLPQAHCLIRKCFLGALPSGAILVAEDARAKSDSRVPGHIQLTRRSFTQLGSAAAAAWIASPLAAADPSSDRLLREAIAKLEYLTPLDRAYILDKGKAGVAKLPPEKLREIGLLPDTWTLDVLPDPASNRAVDKPLTRALGTHLDWAGLMKLAKQHAVRFLSVTTCTNGADPYHMSLWEGVPLREILLLTQPKSNIRRVCYQSYHPGNLPAFQASLSLAQILEAPPGQMPVILAYKMDGQSIPASHGGPARVVVPGSYGSKSIKWVQRVVLTNDYKLNDSDAELNNDTECPMKTQARFVNAPSEIPAGEPAALTGRAQVGMSGIGKAPYCVHSQKNPWPAGDPYWTRADWKDAAILPPPSDWGGGLPGGKLPANISQFDPAKGTPLQWPLRNAIVYWAARLPGLPAGSYDLCCRTIDANGIAQPMPRPPLPRTGANAIHRVSLVVKA
jgi:DMSO/TMAO reductase YedYZ molybdopterin-dependent catalytic subunit